jgi:predicted nucleic acid-binding protein
MSDNFLDSNIFVYLFDDRDDRKREIAERLVRQGLESSSASISYQVIQETLNVLTRKLAVPASESDARRFLDDVLVPLWKVWPSQRLYHRALDIQNQYRYGFYDSLILGAAIEGGCSTLQTEDLQDGQSLGGVVIANPFRPLD